MNEAHVVRNLVTALEKAMPGAVIIKHNDQVTEGIPDLSVTWGYQTVWLECKYGDGEIRPAQEVTMRRLCQMGMAYYIIFNWKRGPDLKLYRHAVTLIKGYHKGELVGWVTFFGPHNVKDVAEWLKKMIKIARHCTSEDERGATSSMNVAPIVEETLDRLGKLAK